MKKTAKKSAKRTRAPRQRRASAAVAENVTACGKYRIVPNEKGGGFRQVKIR